MALVAVAALWFATIVPGQNSTAAVQRTNDGKPNLNGIWQAVTTANWNIEAHQAEPGPRPEIMGAWGAQPGGLGIVEGGAIPYNAGGAGAQAAEPQESYGDEGDQRIPPGLTPATRSSSVIGPGCRARTTCRFRFRFSRARTNPDDLRIQGLDSPGLCRSAPGGASRFVDGMVQRQLGRAIRSSWM